MSERDPRVDPRTGDKLRSGSGRRLTVADIDQNSVRVLFFGGSTVSWPWPEWRKWAATAEVIHRAEDTNGQ